ncbi:Ku protein [Streptomyces sp. NPDC015220]|uniref:non-homologous end joining protein Ku n=1 Tax=Streptomyces sp. NPDC015220 TaxID=3364947 RepID=UPI0036FABDF6
MPRTIWSGAISFGLVTVPIHVQSATEDHSVHFHQYHLSDMGRIRTRKVCELEGREVGQGEIGKGYEWSSTQVVPISDAELDNLPLPTAKAIEIDAFVPLASVDPVRIGEGYYLAPDGQVAAKPYKLLRQALARSSKVAVAKWAWHGRERLGLLRVREDVLVLHLMRWPDEIRDPAQVAPPQVRVTEEEIDGALALMDSMTREDLDGPEFRDTYTEALEEIIEAKREHREPAGAPEPEAEPGKVLDLMAALNESVARAKASRGDAGGAEVHELPAKKASARQRGGEPAAGKSAAAKKTPAPKKAAAKKTAARKPRRSA